MTNEGIIKTIKKAIEKNSGNFQPYEDLFQVLRSIGKETNNNRVTFEHIDWLRLKIVSAMRESEDSDFTIKLYDLLKRTYLFCATERFSDYMIYLEWNRPPQERFYQPRQKQLKDIVEGLQALADDELDELFMSMPPRVGKTSILMFFITWIIGKDSEKSNLYSAFSDTITTAMYNGVMEILNDPMTYLWHDVFPLSKIVETNAKNETLNLDRRKRFPSATFRSLYGSLNGACDCSGYLISDDLIGGIEEALNKDRLISAWSKVDNNLIPRKKEHAKIIWCGTRWSSNDPTGLRINILETDKRFEGHRYKIINVPALNEYGESNFDYDYGVGFSTAYYLQRKASFETTGDEASWYAQYMGEPVERKGMLFEANDMRYYNGDLPEDEYLVRKFMAVDPAFGGGDFTSAPICYQYVDGSTFVVDVAYSNADKRVTQPLLVQKIVEWEVSAVQFECNRSTVAYKEAVEEMLKDRGYKCNVTYKNAPNQSTKEYRIFDKAPEIRSLYFLDGKHRSREYEQFMNNVFSFNMNGNNKHDDAVDSLAQAIDMQLTSGQNVIVRRRVW